MPRCRSTSTTSIVVAARVVVQRLDDLLGACAPRWMTRIISRQLVASAAVGSVSSPSVVLERTDGVDHRVDRVVDLVRDAGDEAAHRRHLLGAHQLVLGALQLVERVGELLVAALELGGAARHLLLEREVDLRRRAQLVVERAAHLLEREGEAADLVALRRRCEITGRVEIARAIASARRSRSRMGRVRSVATRMTRPIDASEQHEEEVDQDLRSAAPIDGPRPR